MCAVSRVASENVASVFTLDASYPKRWKPDDVIRLYNVSYTASEKWERDEKRIQHLRDLGFHVLVIWESDDIEHAKIRLSEHIIHGN